MAVLFGVQIALKRGWPAIQVEGDCLTVVRSLQMATPAK